MIDPKEYFTIIQAAKKVGCTRRSLYRIIDRLGADNVVVKIFGRRLIHKSKIAALRQEYAPVGSTKRHQFAVEFGRRGGTQKAVNARRSP